MRALLSTLSGLALLLGGSVVHAQQVNTGGGGGFTGSSGGFTGSSGGGFTGSSGGGFTGSSSGGFTGSSGGGFTGSSSGGFTGSSSGGFTGSGGGFTGSGGGATTGGGGATTGRGGTTQYGTTSFLGAHYGNPLAMGARATGSTGGARSTGTTGAYSTTNYGSLSFGQPVYTVQNSATVSRTGNLGTGSTLGGQGTTGRLGQGLGTGLGAAQTFRGATSGGIRRAPQYVAEPIFDRAAPRPTVTAMRADLQEVLSTSSRLPSGGRIQVITEGEKVVLRGTVATARERRIAEAMIRMTPGVREVSNELKAAEDTPR